MIQAGECRGRARSGCVPSPPALPCPAAPRLMQTRWIMQVLPVGCCSRSASPSWRGGPVFVRAAAGSAGARPWLGSSHGPVVGRFGTGEDSSVYPCLRTEYQDFRLNTSKLQSVKMSFHQCLTVDVLKLVQSKWLLSLICMIVVVKLS